MQLGTDLASRSATLIMVCINDDDDINTHYDVYVVTRVVNFPEILAKAWKL